MLVKYPCMHQWRFRKETCADLCEGTPKAYREEASQKMLPFHTLDSFH